MLLNDFSYEAWLIQWKVVSTFVVLSMRFTGFRGKLLTHPAFRGTFSIMTEAP